MSCAYCRIRTAEKLSSTLIDGRLLGPEAPRFARYHVDSPGLEVLVVVEVCARCLQISRAELAHLKGQLLQWAADPSQSKERLAALAGMYHAEPAFHRALMKNPNAPLGLLRRLIPYYFDEFLENPALPLWCLEDPALLSRLAMDCVRPAYSSRVSLDSPRLPFSASWLSWLSRSEDAAQRSFVALYDELPERVAWALADDPSPGVRGLLAKHADVELLFYLSRDPEIDVRVMVAQFGLHAEALEQLAADPYHEVRCALARNPHIALSARMRRALFLELNSEEKPCFCPSCVGCYE